MWFVLVLWSCLMFTVGFGFCALLAAAELERQRHSSGER